MRFQPPQEPTPDDEIDAEIAAHLDALTARFITEGLAPEAARAAALERFGDPKAIRAEVRPLAEGLARRRRLRSYFVELWQDIQYAARSLRAAPLFATVAILTLAIGIGANTAMFSVAHAVLLRPLPYANAERAVVLWNSYAGTGLLDAAVAPAEYAELREQLRTTESLVALRPQATAITNYCRGASACDAIQASGYLVSPELFDALGTRAALGRTFSTADVAGDAAPVMVISHALWRDRFGSDPAIIGRTVTTDGVLRTIVGVMRAEVRFPDTPLGYLHESADLWIPVDWMAQRGEPRGNQFLAVVAVRKAEAAPEALRAELDLVESRFQSEHPDRYTGPAGWRLVELPLRTQLTGEMRPALLLFSATVALVLLIACANVANLILARGASRRGEFVVRAALGAHRGRLVRQVFAESLTLGAIGGVAGIALAFAAVRALRLVAPADLPYLAIVRVDGAVLAFALATAFVASTLCGLLPALQQSRGDLASDIRAGGRGLGGNRAGRRVRRALVVAEVSLTLVVLIGAGLLASSFGALQRERPPFKAEGVLTFELTLTPADYVDGNAIIAFDDALRTRLRELPGVHYASGVYPLPLSGDRWSGTYDVEGKDMTGLPDPSAHYHRVLPAYFETMGITLRGGREFTTDDRRGTLDVVVVNDVLARAHWPREDPIGKRINIVGQPDGEWSTVVGVAPTVKGLGPQDAEEPQIYMPMLQRPQRLQRFVVRSSGDPLTLVSGVREVVRSMNPALPAAKMIPMTTLEARAVAPQRFNAMLLSMLGIVALILAATGLYGVVAYLVIQRTHEMAVRLALGSRPRAIIALVLRDGLAMAVTGIAIGLGAAWALARVLTGLLYGLSATDTRIYLAVAGMLAFVLLVASWVPARRASKIEPAQLLRGS